MGLTGRANPLLNEVYPSQTGAIYSFRVFGVFRGQIFSAWLPLSGAARFDRSLPRKLFRRLDENLSGGGETEGRRAGADFFQGHQPAGEIAVGDSHRGPGQQSVLFGEVQELG